MTAGKSVNTSADLEPDIATVGALISAPARAAMMMALLSDQALPAGELAYCAYITPQTASTHLAKMVEGGLVVMEVRGRHRYYRIANHEVAHAIESMMTIALQVPVRSLPLKQTANDIRLARTCYDHIAGKLGVMLADKLLAKGCLSKSANAFVLTEQREFWFRQLGIEVDLLQRQRRIFASCCLDWTERRHHIGGALGAAIATQFFVKNWIVRVPRTRAISLTQTGRRALSDIF